LHIDRELPRIGKTDHNYTTDLTGFPFKQNWIFYQYGDFTLRTLVTGTLPRLGGGGKPQRIMESSRSPSGAVLTTGAMPSGKTAGKPESCPSGRAWP
jgi:hypothetical protein